MSKYKDMDLMMDPEGEIGNTPSWLQLGKSIDTRVFCEEFLEENPMLCINNQFFSVDGLIPDENSIKKKIYEKLKPWFAAGLAVQHQIGIAQRVIVDQVVQLAAVEPCLGKLVFHGDGVNCDCRPVR